MEAQTPPPPPGATLQCSKHDIEQCGYDHAPVTRGRMRTQFPLPHGPPVLSLNSSAVLMVESFWLLLWSSVHCYKERYESDSTSSKQASADPDFTSGLSAAGARLVMRRRFKMVDGVEYFEVQKESGYGRTPPQWGPVKPAKGTGPSRGSGCGIAPDWSDGIWRPSRWTSMLQRLDRFRKGVSELAPTHVAS